MTAPLRPVTSDDLPLLMAMMAQNIETAMFPLMNLRDHGLEAEGRYAMRGWCRPDCSGAVFITGGGMVQPQMPAAGPSDWHGAAQAMAGEALEGVVGDPIQVRAFLAAADLSAAPMALASEDAAYTLDLAALVMPDLAGLHLVPLSESDRSLVETWLTHYQVEALGTAESKATEAAPGMVDRALSGGRHRLILKESEPVALTAFNATYDDVVQIGPVYTPPPHRNRGYARAAVALQLVEVREAGATRALLFTDSPAAMRAYEALGFTHWGSFGLFLFEAPTKVRL